MNRIKQLRQAIGLKQTDLASALNIGQATISNWENGKTEPDGDSLQRMSAFFDASIDYILGNSEIKQLSVKKGIRIPVYGDVAAGLPIEATENIVDYEEIDTALATTGDFFGLRVRGDSMEPRIQEGDVVIVRKQNDAETGEIAIVMVNGDSATIKRIKKESSGLSLIPNNPAYDIKYFSNDDISTLPVQIIGKVVELRGKF